MYVPMMLVVGEIGASFWWYWYRFGYPTAFNRARYLSLL